MKLFIVAIPLFDVSMQVRAYHLRDRNAESVPTTQVGNSRMMDALQSPGLDLVEKLGVESFAADKLLFIDINPCQLMMGCPMNRNIPPKKVVCTFPGGLANDENLLENMKKLKQAGYTLALDDFPLNGIQSPFFSLVDYLILDSKNPRFPIIFKAVRSQLRHIRLVITNVPDQGTFNNLSLNKDALFTGSFYSQPITAGSTKMSPVKINALQLLNQVNEPDFDLADIAQTIERDPALSISLLRFINSGASGSRRKIESIRSAVAILGQEEVRRWATVAIQVNLSDDKPGEITKLSLVRAKFAENLAGAFELGIFEKQLFLMGLFSLLDVVLQKPMSQAVLEIPLDDRVRQALVEKSGSFAPILELIYEYERADWDTCMRILIQNNVSVDAVHNSFVQALAWYNQLLSITG